MATKKSKKPAKKSAAKKSAAKKPVAKKSAAKKSVKKKTAAKKGDPDAVYERLRAILAGVAKSDDLVVNHDHATGMQVNSARHTYKGAPLFFGGLARKKSYTSYYLMGVYIWPDLLDGMSPELKKRMQGKSCFNFNTVDAALFTELANLTEKTHQAYATREPPMSHRK